MYESLSVEVLFVGPWTRFEKKKKKKCVSADTHAILQQDKRLAFGIYYTDFQNGAAHTLLSISKYCIGIPAGRGARRRPLFLSFTLVTVYATKI